MTARSKRRHTLCLNMIVKNESSVIRRCLDSVRPRIDHWLLVDTGSTDGSRPIGRQRMRGIVRTAFVVVALGIALGAPPVRAQEAETKARDLAVSVENGLVSVDVGKVPIADVLRAIAEQAGAELIVRGDPGITRPQSFTGMTLEKGIRRLLRGRKGIGVTIAYKPATAGQGAGAPARIVVFASSKAGTARATRPTPIGTIVVPGQALGDRVALRAEVRDLAASKVPAAAERLGQILVESDDAAVRRQAAEALGKFQNSDPARTALIDALWDPDWRARMAAFNALARVGGDGIAPVFRQVLADADDPRSRRMAALLLARYPGEATRKALDEARLDPESSVSAAAEHAIGLWRQKFGQ